MSFNPEDAQSFVTHLKMKTLCNCGAPMKLAPSHPLAANEDRDSDSWKGCTIDPASHSMGCPYRVALTAFITEREPARAVVKPGK